MSELDYYLTYDDPIPYKDLKIYPATMREYLDFHTYATCLLYEKNSIPNPRFISMSYLRYIFYLAEEENSLALHLLYMLLKLVLHIKDDESIKFYKKNELAFFSVNNVEYDANDFDKIKNIICIQNGIQQIDETIKKEVRDALKKAQEYKMQQNQNKMCSLEDQMLCVVISSSLKLDDIYKLSIRKFSKILERIDYKMHYEIYLSASLSGFVEFKNKDALKPWMAELEQKDIYGDVKIDENKMQSTIDGINNPNHK